MKKKPNIIDTVLPILGQSSQRTSLQNAVRCRGRTEQAVMLSPGACACCSEETSSYQWAQPLLDSSVEPAKTRSTTPLFPVIPKPIGAVSSRWQVLPTRAVASRSGRSKPVMRGVSLRSLAVSAEAVLPLYRRTRRERVGRDVWEGGVL